jgi:WD40-like Beta Propeller Repeat
VKARDLVIVGTVLLVGGFAAADALRSEGDSAAPATTARTTGETAETSDEQARVETIDGLPAGALRGRLVYTDGACGLRDLELSNGIESQFDVRRTSCGLVAAPEGDRVAVSLPSRFRGVSPYLIVALARPETALADFRARNRSVVWSPDGDRVAWCDPSGRGWELELGFEPRPLRSCPAAYTHTQEAVSAEGREVRIGDRLALTAPARIRALSFSGHGSAAVATERRLYVWDDALSDEPTLVNEVVLPPELHGLDVRFSPDHCHAALLFSEFPPAPTVFVVALQDCGESRAPLTVPGRAAAWSPDGDRLAVSDRRDVVVHHVLGSGPAIVVAIEASALAWTR